MSDNKRIIKCPACGVVMDVFPDAAVCPYCGWISPFIGRVTRVLGRDEQGRQVVEMEVKFSKAFFEDSK